ncbi:MAG: nucleotidyl transferase AbiEii/AbiGii toxin family protein [Rhodospirillaceae bacterium]|nr:nucleotidyl transferase AbiEii/AbiGii toxin family protein [Rhodospirillaceae bacterium]
MGGSAPDRAGPRHQPRHRRDLQEPRAREARPLSGGTALNKLHFPAPIRYSEDIDLVRTTAGPIKPLLDGLRDVLEPWLGKPVFDASAVAPKLTFRVPAEDDGQIRLKVEINTREIVALDAPLALPYAIDNPWFTGRAEIQTFSREEMLATKLRALLQRDKGRDLFDLDHALNVFDGLDAARVVAHLGTYLKGTGLAISRAQAEERMFKKLAASTFLTDMKPLLSADQAEKMTADASTRAFSKVFGRLVALMPGESWARTPAMMEKFGIDLRGGEL